MSAANWEIATPLPPLMAAVESFPDHITGVVGVIALLLHVGKTEVQWNSGSWLRLTIKAAPGMEILWLMSSFPKIYIEDKQNFVRLVLFWDRVKLVGM